MSREKTNRARLIDDHSSGRSPSPRGSRFEGSSECAIDSGSSPGSSRRLHRGENNRAMRDYAERIGASYLVENGLRCSVCSHVESRFVARGRLRICQVCFAKGVRFEQHQ
jgi:hypothetical protein